MVMTVKSTNLMILWVLSDFALSLSHALQTASNLAPPKDLAPRDPAPVHLIALPPIFLTATPPTAQLVAPPSSLAIAPPIALAWHAASPTVQSAASPIVQLVAFPTVPIAAFPIVLDFACPLAPLAAPVALAVATAWPPSSSYAFGSPLQGKGGSDGTLGHFHSLALSRTMRKACRCLSHVALSQQMEIQHQLAKRVGKMGWGQR